MDNNALDYDLGKGVGEFFRLSNSQMEIIIEEVVSAVKNWRKVAKVIGISNAEQELIDDLGF